MVIKFENSKVHDILLRIAAEFEVDPQVPLECEDYFKKLLKQYPHGTNIENLAEWLREHLKRDFKSLDAPPRWIQGPEWPFDEDQPMIFVGQIDIRPTAMPNVKSMYHDETSFYVFTSATGWRRQVIVQQF